MFGYLYGFVCRIASGTCENFRRRLFTHLNCNLYTSFMFIVSERRTLSCRAYGTDGVYAVVYLSLYQLGILRFIELAVFKRRYERGR